MNDSDSIVSFHLSNSEERLSGTLTDIPTRSARDRPTSNSETYHHPEHGELTAHVTQARSQSAASLESIYVVLSYYDRPFVLVGKYAIKWMGVPVHQGFVRTACLTS